MINFLSLVSFGSSLVAGVQLVRLVEQIEHSRQSERFIFIFYAYLSIGLVARRLYKDISQHTQSIDLKMAACGG